VAHVLVIMGIIGNQIPYLADSQNPQGQGISNSVLSVEKSSCGSTMVVTAALAGSFTGGPFCANSNCVSKIPAIRQTRKAIKSAFISWIFAENF
jgi:hypothetical protein